MTYELPTWEQIAANAIGELIAGRTRLSDGADWLRSDWAGCIEGTPLPPGAADAKREVFRLIAEAKGLIDQAKNALFATLPD